MRTAQSLYDWQGGQRLPDQEMEEFRALFHRWVLERIDLGRHLVAAESPQAQVIMSAIFPEMSFVIENAPGAGPGPGRERFTIEHSPAGLRLLLAARWYAQHGHWNPETPDRLWDFPRGLRPADLHTQLEEWLCYCADKVERRFLSVIAGGGTGPAEAVTVLRAAALRALGQLASSTDAGTMDAIMTGTAGSGPWSAPWQELAGPACETIRLLPPEFITEFAAARQSDTGEPQVVDAALLEPAVARAVHDPAAAIAQLGQFPAQLSVLEQARTQWPADWDQAIQAERTDLLEEIRYIVGALGPDGSSIVDEAAEFGRDANAAKAFRPKDGYARFRSDIDRLRAVQGGVSQWIAAQDAFSRSGGTAAVFDAQPWAAHVREYAHALRSVLEAVRATAADLERRTASKVGGSPGQLAEEVAGQIDEAAGLLEDLSGTGAA